MLVDLNDALDFKIAAPTFPAVSSKRWLLQKHFWHWTSILLGDEPTGNLDPDVARWDFQLFQKS